MIMPEIPTERGRLADFQSALDFVCDLRNAGSKFSLDRIRKFAEAFGNPYMKYPKKQKRFWQTATSIKGRSRWDR